MTLISKIQYSKHRGITKQAVNDLINNGKLVMVGNKVDVEESDKLLSPIIDNEDLDYNEARTKEKNFQAKTAELQYLELTKVLVRKTDVEKNAFDNAVEIKNLLLAIPGKVSPIIQGKNNINEIKNILKDEIVNVLESLKSKYE